MTQTVLVSPTNASGPSWPRFDVQDVVREVMSRPVDYKLAAREVLARPLDARAAVQEVLSRPITLGDAYRRVSETHVDLAAEARKLMSRPVDYKLAVQEVLARRPDTAAIMREAMSRSIDFGEMQRRSFATDPFMVQQRADRLAQVFAAPVSRAAHPLARTRHLLASSPALLGDFDDAVEEYQAPGSFGPNVRGVQEKARVFADRLAHEDENLRNALADELPALESAAGLAATDLHKLAGPYGLRDYGHDNRHALGLLGFMVAGCFTYVYVAFAGDPIPMVQSLEFGATAYGIITSKLEKRNET